MRTLLKGAFVASVLVALTGCGGMTGAWTMDTMTPNTEEKAFPLKTLCLHKDNTFCMHMACGKTMTGTWEYNDDAKLLNFVDAKGDKRSYKACLCGMSGKLEVQPTEAGENWKATMKRGKCACDKKACEMKKCEPANCPSKKKPPAEAEEERT